MRLIFGLQMPLANKRVTAWLAHSQSYQQPASKQKRLNKSGVFSDSKQAIACLPPLNIRSESDVDTRGHKVRGLLAGVLFDQGTIQMYRHLLVDLVSQTSRCVVP